MYRSLLALWAQNCKSRFGSGKQTKIKMTTRPCFTPAKAPYMREIGAMSQIGVSTGNSCRFMVSKMGRCKNKERFLKALEAKWHIPSP